MDEIFFTRVLIVLAALPFIGCGQPHVEPIPAGRTDIVFSTDFESDKWTKRWTRFTHAENMRLVDRESAAHLKTDLDGKSLEVRVPKGEHYGVSGKLPLKSFLGYEPEELYSRFYLNFATDVLNEDGKQGYTGKAPGFDGTYSKEGWGGKPNKDGTKGWSARGSLVVDAKSNKIQVGFYSYEIQQGDYVYGRTMHYDAPIAPEQWYCVEQHIKLNTPGKRNGILRGWIDGKLVFEKTDCIWRNADELKINSYWLDFYRGGKQPANHDHHIYIDNLAIATDGRLGPIVD